jgi:hydrogenase maturation protease
MPEDLEGSHDKVRVLILGVGNRLLGDDGAGSYFAEALSSMNIPEWMRVVDGGIGGIELLEEIEDCGILFVVDSLSPEEGEPGDVRVYRVDRSSVDREILLKHLISSWSHGVTAEVLIAAAVAMGKLPETYVVGIVPSSIDLREGLSPEVKMAFPKVLDVITRILRDKKLDIDLDIGSFLKKIDELC